MLEKALIRPIVACLAPHGPPLPARSRAGVIDAAAAFVARQIGLAPLHIRLGALLLALVLRLWLKMLTPGVSDDCDVPLQAARAVALFERLPGPARSAVRLYRSMTVLAYYEHPALVAALEFPDPVARQEEFREKRKARYLEGRAL